MEKKILILLICKFLFFNSFAVEENISTSYTKISQLKVLTWNVQMLPCYGFLSSSLSIMQHERTDWIIEYIKEQSFDVILLQECFSKKFVSAINTKLGLKYPYQINPSKSHFWKLSNGLMILSKIPMSESQLLEFSQSDEIDVLTSKGAISAKLHIQDKPTYIINTHLQADNHESANVMTRRHQLQEIYHYFVSDHLKDSSCILLGGDLNIAENSETKEYQSLHSELKLKDVVKNYFRVNTYSYAKENSWNKTLTNSMRLDYILSNTNFKDYTIQIIKPKKKYKSEETDLADHYGISACIDL